MGSTHHSPVPMPATSQSSRLRPTSMERMVQTLLWTGTSTTRQPWSTRYPPGGLERPLPTKRQVLESRRGPLSKPIRLTCYSETLKATEKQRREKCTCHFPLLTSCMTATTFPHVTQCKGPTGLTWQPALCETQMLKSTREVHKSPTVPH